MTASHWILKFPGEGSLAGAAGGGGGGVNFVCLDYSPGCRFLTAVLRRPPPTWSQAGRDIPPLAGEFLSV